MFLILALEGGELHVTAKLPISGAGRSSCPTPR
jgi:hypothetical protein